MQSLQELSSETIRKNWHIYKDHIVINNYFYDMIWNNFYKKFDFNVDEMNYVIMFRDFIEGNDIKNNDTPYHFIKENDKTLIIKGMDGEERKMIHKLCDKIGLHHNSVNKNKKKKHLYIYIPEKWSFEYTEKNPYSREDEYYRNLEKQREKNKELERKWLQNKECSNCGTDGLECQLYASVYIRNIYCEDCLEIMSDGEGESLNCHKFEPIN
jgi:hypothetical protein